jgi:hypothetical protein
VEGVSGQIAVDSKFGFAGVLSVEQQSTVGLQAYIDASSFPLEVINPNAIGSAVSSTTVTVKTITSCHVDGSGSCTEASASSDASSSAACTSSDTSVIKCTGATAFFSGS